MSARTEDAGGRGSGDGILRVLARVLEARRDADARHSYVGSLYAAGLDAILKKVGEEATEVILAAKGNDPEAVVRETADLWFHTLVMLAKVERHPDDVLHELERRMGISGLEEQAGRGVSGPGTG